MISPPRAVHFLIGLALIAALCAGLVLQIFPLWQQSQQGWEPSISARTAVTQPKVKQHSVAEFSLFGNVNQSPAVVPDTPKDLPATRLRLTLTGVLAGREDKLTGALIEGPDRDTGYYKIGDELPGNAKLHKVFADRVVVERSGRLENLFFPESAAPMQAVQEFDNAPANTLQNTAPPPTNTPVRDPNVLSEQRRQSIKDRLSNLRQRIINNRN